MHTRSRLFDLIIVRSWWVILILLASLMVFDITSRKRHREYERLFIKRVQLTHDLQAAKHKNELLTQQVASQDDPSWLELVLMRNLGLVPKQSTKWIYAPSSEPDRH